MVNLDQRSFFKRVLGHTKLCKPDEEKPSFDIRKKYNEHPYAEGIISTCLFGKMDTPRFRNTYIKPLLYNANILNTLLPNWYLRVYMSPNTPQSLINDLIQKDCEVYIMDKLSNKYIGTMWRFLPAGETIPFVTHDADMRLDEKNIHIAPLSKNIKKWMKKNKKFFKRNLSLINLTVPLSAGMWGAKPAEDNKPPIPDIKERMEKYCNNWFGCDEAFLTKEIWPEFKTYGYYSVYNRVYIGLIIFLFILMVIILYSKIIHR